MTIKHHFYSVCHTLPENCFKLQALNTAFKRALYGYVQAHM